MIYLNNTYTIYLDKNLYQLLEKDREAFKYKNKGPFIKAIISNYNEEFQRDFYKLEEKIIKTIGNNNDIDSYRINNFCWQIAKINIHGMCKLHELENEPKKTKRISLRENKDEILFDISEKFYIDTNITANEYYNTILYSYINLPKTKREKIVFQPIYKKLQSAIKDKNKIKIKYRSNTTEQTHEETVLPYEICPHKDQMYNYLLFQNTNENGEPSLKTVHLYNIIKVTKLTEIGTFEPKIIEYFNRMKKNGPQFYIGNSDKIIRLKFLEDGLKLYNLRYIERPVGTIIDEEEQIYEFDCSYLQFSKYFASFYNKIKIIEPQEYIDKLTSTLTNTLDIYKQ